MQKILIFMPMYNPLEYSNGYSISLEVCGFITNLPLIDCETELHLTMSKKV